MKKLLVGLMTLLLLFSAPSAYAAADVDATVTILESSENYVVYKVLYTQSGAAGTLAHSILGDYLHFIRDSEIVMIYVDKASTDTPELAINTESGPSGGIPLIAITDIADNTWYGPYDFGIDTAAVAPIVDSLIINISDAGADTETVTLYIYFKLNRPNR